MRICLLISLFIIGCKTSQSPQMMDPEVTDFIGSNYNAEANESNTFILYTSLEEEQIGESKTKYVIYDLSTNQIYKKGVLVKGSIHWLNDSQLEVQKVPGIVKPGEPIKNEIITLTSKSK